MFQAKNIKENMAQAVMSLKDVRQKVRDANEYFMHLS